MRARHNTTALLLAGAAVSLVYGALSTARADEAQVADPFAAVQTIEQGDLDGLRGGDSSVEGSYNSEINKTTSSTATNESTNTIDNPTFNTSGGSGGGNGGNISGGAVSFSDHALANFGGIFTGAINTAPGGMATAQTSLGLTLNP
jgi:hypothetical protein